METKKTSKIIVTKKQIYIIILVVGLLIVASMFDTNSPETVDNLPKSPQQPTTNGLSFNQISQVDQNRIEEIITGVMQNTVPVTPEIKNELKNIFKKYNATETEIKDFAKYGPATAINYQKLFFTDAVQSISNEFPFKSLARGEYETKALSLGLMTIERIKQNDENMQLIANHKSIIDSNGNKIVITTDSINKILDNINLSLERLNELLQ